ncbi:RidA family protein [Allorhodopirellula heiligendammensis]|uniref:Endoribonuclease L-PSP n=1 Tax=Allorhodopirellula heiligendammensis TaxID=2714739 RepID=A0A5C6C2X4_9BACT|nr:RidA family protein [Allorhodopirellula heiligendammensis]TWU18357.1 Endoribonuclease L-PSP [Allorhodopirellula heiligendammensis]|tara:strand:+ start:463 stop:924 length:462 start_codon:yes stop_codon:yes gene_type:complete
MSHDARIEQLNLELPPPPQAMGLYKPIVQVGNLVYLSGHGPLQSDGYPLSGRLGADMDVDSGQAAARLTGLAMLSTLRNHLGTLDRVSRLVKLLGLVRCTESFNAQPAVINGCSELFREVFGNEAGIGARSAIGASALPADMAVEIEAIFEVE